jgi:hypothetical protein
MGATQGAAAGSSRQAPAALSRGCHELAGGEGSACQSLQGELLRHVKGCLSVWEVRYDTAPVVCWCHMMAAAVCSVCKRCIASCSTHAAWSRAYTTRCMDPLDVLGVWPHSLRLEVPAGVCH